MAFSKILCATDFSPGANQALRAAIRLANADGAELVLANVWQMPMPSFGGEFAYAASAIQGWIDDVDAALVEAARQATELGAKRLTTRRLTGVPWAALTGVLDDDPAFDLVVVGTRGRSGLTRVLLGSVAEQVVRHAPCSVLAVRGEAKPFSHVLCPVDFSAQSVRTVELAAQLVQPGGAGLALLHVVEPPTVYTAELPPELMRDAERDARDGLARLAAEVRGKVPVTTHTSLGRAGSAVLRVLDGDPSFDLVVTGSHGRTGIRRVLLGSVAEKIVRHAPCPVLVARPR